MADTLPNVVVPAETVVDLYSETGITVGTALAVQMIGGGIAKLYSGATLTEEPTDAIGFEPIYQRELHVNTSGDAGAFIWSTHGCTVNVKEA